VYRFTGSVVSRVLEVPQCFLVWRLGACRSALASLDTSSARATGLRVAARLFLRASMRSTTGAANAGCAFPTATSPLNSGCDQRLDLLAVFVFELRRLKPGGQRIDQFYRETKFLIGPQTSIGFGIDMMSTHPCIGKFLGLRRRARPCQERELSWLLLSMSGFYNR